jgi:hypothetical protein
MTLDICEICNQLESEVGAHAIRDNIIETDLLCRKCFIKKYGAVAMSKLNKEEEQSCP